MKFLGFFSLSLFLSNAQSRPIPLTVPAVPRAGCYIAEMIGGEVRPDTGSCIGSTTIRIHIHAHRRRRPRSLHVLIIK